MSDVVPDFTCAIERAAVLPFDQHANAKDAVTTSKIPNFQDNFS
jgi:hypothetical protein